MASTCGTIPDIFSWIQNLPPIPQWKTKSLSLLICSSSSPSSSARARARAQPSLNLSADIRSSSMVSFSITAEIGLTVSLWTSKSLNSSKLLDEDGASNLFINFIEVVLSYGLAKNSFTLRIPKPEQRNANFKDMFNLAFQTLLFLICIYEAPMDLRSTCLNSIKNHLADCGSRNATRSLMKLLGSNLEEQWMRSMNLAITNWTNELNHAIKTPSPLFSYALSTFGLWKVHLYSPVIAMDTVNSSHSAVADNDYQRLLFSLNYHQLEGVMQFNYKVLVQPNWIDVMVNIDNIRCDVIRLVNEILMNEQGEGAAEKHFPSRISLRLTPIQQTNILSVSVGRSSENPSVEIGHEKALEAGFDPPNPYMGIKVSTAEISTVTLKPWKFEQSVSGYGANFNWFLHDSNDGREVFSSKPSMLAILNPRAWFKDRYSSAHRPFTRQGGIVFAGDEYGDGVKWKVDKRALGRTMEWEIRGWIWLTYLPNKHRTFYNETRRLEFKEVLRIPIT